MHGGYDVYSFNRHHPFFLWPFTSVLFNLQMWTSVWRECVILIWEPPARTLQVPTSVTAPLAMLSTPMDTHVWVRYSTTHVRNIYILIISCNYYLYFLFYFSFFSLFSTDVNECSEGIANCAHECTNTEGSFECSCRDGYILASDGQSCQVDCGGLLIGSAGFFKTPGWPISYPSEEFECEWEIQIPDSEASIQFSIESPYGILGSGDCPTDYIQFFDGTEDDAASLGKHCFLIVPDPFTTSGSTARIKFYSTGRPRPSSRNGVKVTYTSVKAGKREGS